MEFNIIKKISRGKFYGRELEICELYFNQRKSLNEVSRELGCDNKFIRVFFKNNDLPTRSIGEGLLNKDILDNEKDILNMYNNGHASKDIADKYSVDLGTILNCLRRCGNKIRTAKEARTTEKVLEKDKLRRISFSESEIEKIITMYNDGDSAVGISKLYDCDSAVIKRVLLENGVNFRGIDTMYTDKIKERHKNTFMKRFGSWNNRNKILQRKLMEKYDGATGAMQVPKFFHTQQSSAFKVKTEVLDGIQLKYQGYELLAIKLLLREGYDIGDIKIGKSGVPHFKYFFDGKVRTYYPDIYIPKDNRIIEVKSNYYYKLYLDKNMAKKDSVVKNGYIFDFYIMNKIGERI